MRRIRPCTVAIFALTGILLAMPASATPPGKNGKLIWQQETPDKPPKLFVANPDGSALRKVFATKNLAEFEGAFSPTNSNQVAFTRGSERPFSERIYLGNLATGRATKLPTGNVIAIGATFSPTGRTITFWGLPIPKSGKPDDAGHAAIYVVRTDGTGLRRLSSRTRESFDADFSPSGKQLVYTEGREVSKDHFHNRFVLIDIDGRHLRVITSYGGNDELNPKWMPDGKHIVFESRPYTKNGYGSSDIRIMDASGKNVKTLLGTAAYETNPIPSPDGTRIAFTSDRDRRGRERLGAGFELYTMKLDGTDIVRVTNNRLADIFPEWQRLP